MTSTVETSTSVTTSTSTCGEAYDVVVTTSLPATPRRVLAAWTDANQLVSWWVVPGFTTPRRLASVEAHVGGRWRVLIVPESGAAIAFNGEIRVLDTSERLVITLVDKPSPDSDIHSEMHVVLRPMAAGTEMEFHHFGFGDSAEAESLAAGYAYCFFPNLAAFLAARES